MHLGYLRNPSRKSGLLFGTFKKDSDLNAKSVNVPSSELTQEIQRDEVKAEAVSARLRLNLS